MEVFGIACAHGDTYSDRHRHGNPYSYGYFNANANCDRDRDTYCNADAHCYRYCHGYSDCYAYTDGNGNGYRHSIAYRYSGNQHSCQAQGIIGFYRTGFACCVCRLERHVRSGVLFGSLACGGSRQPAEHGS